MGIPLTHVGENDNFAQWKKQEKPLEMELNTLARSKKWMNGSAPRTAAVRTYNGCAGPTGLYAGGAVLSGSLG